MKCKTATPSSNPTTTKSTSTKSTTPSAASKAAAAKPAKPRSAAAKSSKAAPTAKKPKAVGALSKPSTASKSRSVRAVLAVSSETATAQEPVSSALLPSKQSQVITLLRGDSGASMPQLMTLTGWQSHTVRGMLSGSLRKRLGLNVRCQREGGARVYRIVQEATEQ